MDITEEIKKLVQDKFKVNISEEEIEAIISSQSRAIKFAMENELDIKLIYFGKFIIKEGRKAALSRNQEYMKNIRLPKEKGMKKINFGIRINKETNPNDLILETEPLIKIHEAKDI